MTLEGTDKLVIRWGRNRIGRREKRPKKSWEEGEIGGKSREEGEIGSKSRGKGTLLAEPFLMVHMLCTKKRLCTNRVKFLLSMLSALLSNSFEPKPNRCSFLTVSFRPHFYLPPAGSVSIIGSSQNLMLALEKPV